MWHSHSSRSNSGHGRISGTNGTPKSHIHNCLEKEAYETINLTLNHYSWFNCSKFSLKMNTVSSTAVLVMSILFVSRKCLSTSISMLKHKHFNARRTLPNFTLNCHITHSLTQLPSSSLKSFSLIHGGKQLSKCFTAALSCADFLYCELLVISAKTIFCGFDFFNILNHVHMCPLE